MALTVAGSRRWPGKPTYRWDSLGPHTVDRTVTRAEDGGRIWQEGRGRVPQEGCMKTRAAVLRDMGKDWEITELDLDPPRDGEVLIRFVAAGLCHFDDHLRTGDIPVRYPIVGGHEGAGIVEKVGPGVTRLSAGDHVITSWLPVCGHCRFCSRGQTNLCDLGRFLVDNSLPDGTYRYHEGSTDFGQMCLLGTFSQYAVISEASAVKVEDDLPLEVVVLVGCGVPTGYGTAVKAGEVHPGDTTIVYGVGGVGINAVQGA